MTFPPSQIFSLPLVIVLEKTMVNRQEQTRQNHSYSHDNGKQDEDTDGSRRSSVSWYKVKNIAPLVVSNLRLLGLGIVHGDGASQ
jgi:hypothetical protein